MQPTIVMAFRKRLKSYGYKDVSIKFDCDSKLYLVSAVDPLGGILISRLCGLEFMYNSFH